MEIKLTAYPKVNIGLYIGQEKDSLHTLISIFQKIPNYSDLITINYCPNEGSYAGSEKPCKINVSGLKEYVPLMQESTCFKAASLFFQKIKKGGQVTIKVEKHIPVKAGLGGGSADAGAVLSGLNELSGQILNREELLNLAKMIGSDVPFFLSTSDAALVSGTGEIITQTEARKDLVFELPVKSREDAEKQNTAFMYKSLNEKGLRTVLPSGDTLLKMYYSPVSEWNFVNDFEIFYKKPKLELRSNERLYLTGAGSFFYKVSELTN